MNHRRENNSDKCAVCDEVILPHEKALFLSGRGNLVQIQWSGRTFLIHPECAQDFPTRSELFRYVTGGEADLSWLE